MTKNSTNKTFSLLKSVMSGKKGKYLLLFFSLTLIICILLISITSLYSIKSSTRIDSERRMETYHAYLDSYIKTLETVIEKCSMNFYSEASVSMPMISIVNGREETWYFSNALTNRALLDLNSMTNRNFIFSDSFFYIPRLNDIYTSNSLHAELSTCSQKIQDIVDIYNQKGNKDYFGVIKSSGSLVVYVEAFMYKDSPRAIIFLTIDTKALAEYLNSVYSSTLEGVQVSVMDADVLLWQTPGNETSWIEDNYEFIQSYSSKLGWSFLLQIPETSLRSLAVTPRLLGFYIALVVIFAFLSLIAAIIMFKPVYSITDAIEKSGMGSSSDKSYVDVIENISSRQKELDNALAVVADEVLRNLFLDLLGGHTKTNSTVQSLLEGIKSSFTPFALYSTICIKYNKEDKEVVQKSEQIIQSFLSKQDIYNDTTSMLLSYREDMHVIVLQFNKNTATISESKVRLKDFVSELSILLNTQITTCAVTFGLLCHSVLDIDMSLKNAFSEQKTNISQNFTTIERTQSAIKALENGNKQEFITALSRVNEAHKAIEDNIQLKEELSITVNLLSESLGISSNFSSLINPLTEKNEIILKYEECEKQIIENALIQIGKKQNPYLIKARSYINDNLNSYHLSLSLIADSIGITPSYLSKLFSDNMGIKLIDYISQERIKHSMEMLNNTDKSILEIAEECGFSSSRNFISAFRKMYNTTPGEFRKSMRLL